MKEHLYMVMVTFLLANLKMIKHVGMVYIHNKMEKFTKASGLMTNPMVKVNSKWLMAPYILVILKVVKNTELENING